MATLLSDSPGNGRTLHTQTHENDSTGPGELLRQARERCGLTLEQISRETRIPRGHLEALEHDDFAAGPAGFYRRAEIRTYARAVKLDQNLALARLERALEPPPVREAMPDTKTQEPTLSPKRLGIAVGVVVTALVLGRATGGREPTFEGGPQMHSATDSPLVSPVRETQPDAVAGSGGELAVATDSTPRRASSNGDVAEMPKQGETRASADSATELVVTTQPAGARVTVDGIGWGIAPVTIRYLQAGDKRIRVSKEGYVAEERVVPLGEGHTKALDIQLRSAP
jgi:cytoskeleton protein RodZ